MTVSNVQVLLTDEELTALAEKVPCPALLRAQSKFMEAAQDVQKRNRWINENGGDALWAIR